MRNSQAGQHRQLAVPALGWMSAGTHPGQNAFSSRNGLIRRREASRSPQHAKAPCENIGLDWAYDSRKRVSEPTVLVASAFTGQSSLLKSPACRKHRPRDSIERHGDVE